MSDEHIEDENTANCNGFEKWTWKDALNRLQYIDQIIDQIVQGATLFNGALLTIFAALCTLSFSNGLSPLQISIIDYAILGVCVIGFIFNIIIAWDLARQEYIRQWYFSLLPNDKIPLFPPKEWLPERFRKIEKHRTLVREYVNSILYEENREKNAQPKTEDNKANKIEYCMDYMKKEEIKEPDKRLWLITLGNIAPGHCKTWFYVFAIMGVLFIIFGLIFCILIFFLK